MNLRIVIWNEYLLLRTNQASLSTRQQPNQSPNPAAERWRVTRAAGDGASCRRTRPWRPPGSWASGRTSLTCTVAWTSKAHGPWSHSASGTPPRPSPSAPLPRRWRPLPPPSAPVFSTATRPATRISQLAGQCPPHLPCSSCYCYSPSSNNSPWMSRRFTFVVFSGMYRYRWHLTTPCV